MYRFKFSKIQIWIFKFSNFQIWILKIWIFKFSNSLLLLFVLLLGYYTYPRVRRYLLLRFRPTIFSKYGTGKKTGTKLIRRMTLTDEKTQTNT